jgi:hypothetical protein
VTPVLNNFFVDRSSFPDDDFDEIKPRWSPYAEEIVPRLIGSITPAEIAAPAPAKPRPDRAWQIAARAILTHAVAPIVKDNPDADPRDGPTQSDILLQAITIVARREPQTAATRAAMRSLIVRFSRECALDF